MISVSAWSVWTGTAHTIPGAMGIGAIIGVIGALAIIIAARR